VIGAPGAGGRRDATRRVPWPVGVSEVRHTAPLISGAAILMVAVFGAFAFTGMVPIEQLGLGMAVGGLLDATIIRLLLVPAAMKLMGRANWWMPFAGRRARVAAAPH